MHRYRTHTCAALTVGDPENRANFMGPVISEGARKTILSYIEAGHSEGRRESSQKKRELGG